MAVADPKAEWKSDLWGRMNKAPDPASVIRTLDGFAEMEGLTAARNALFGDLCLQAGHHVLEAGCGPGTALPALLERVGPAGDLCPRTAHSAPPSGPPSPRSRPACG